MAAMALRLGVRLAKPDAYVLNAEGRIASVADTLQATRLAARVVVVAGLCATAAIACLVAAGAA
jgi:adenosylcobinamide-phosphate synthase